MTYQIYLFVLWLYIPVFKGYFKIKGGEVKKVVLSLDKMRQNVSNIIS